MSPRQLATGILTSVMGLLSADDPPKPPESPVVRLCVPLGIQPATTSKLTSRGQRLEGATEVRLTAPGATVKVLESGKANVPNGQNAGRLGDTPVVVEVTVPDDLGRPPLALIVKTPAGESTPHLLLSGAGYIQAEKEPNDGFRQAQAVTIPGTIEGLIERNQDVDVYKLTGRAGQQLRGEIRAWRQGSALDGWLTLYDAHGQQIATADDRPTDSDPVLIATLPKDGAYFLVVSDALDQGGPTHPYRLTVNLAESDQPR